jgi:DNA polymerase
MELNESTKLKLVREELIAHAKKHELYNNVIKTKGNIVFGRGDDESKILFIGEAPGFSENEIGKPFVGRSGKLLEEWVSELKIKNNEYAIINAVPIIPLGEEGKIRPPTQEEIDYFLPLTMKMIKTINPRVIVLLGKSAARIFGKEAMRVGETIDYFNIKMHFLYHPAYHLRNGRKGLEDLKNLKTLLAQEEAAKKQTSLGNFS